MSSAFIYMIIFIFTYNCRSTECFAVEISSTYELIKIVKEGSKVPRKGYIAKRDVLPDPMYNSKVVTKLINNVMEDGKRGVAQKICYEAFDIMKEKPGKEPLEVFEAALANVMPLLEVKAR